VRNLRLRATLPVHLLSSFPEINVRTYVVFGDKPGIYVFSLDAGNAATVAAARRFYRLPYFHAEASMRIRLPTTCRLTASVALARGRWSGSGASSSGTASLPPAPVLPAVREQSAQR
jgi:uncharacterized protein YqjF (DUF2071 family)